MHLVNDKLAIYQLYFNFLPSWWNKNYGVVWGKKYHFDPDYRVEIWKLIARSLNERFPMLHIGSENPEPMVSQPDFNNGTTPALAGCEVEYPIDNYPWNRHLSPEAIANLTPPENPMEVFPYTEIISQVQYLNKKLGQNVKPWLPVRGVLNDAALIQGNDIFSDMYLQPVNAKKLFDYTSSVMLSLIKYNHDVFGFNDMVCPANCCAMMISPETYREWLLPYDYKITQASYSYGLKFGIHHCGIFDKYAPVYREITRIDYLEIGWDSNIRLALDMFPEARVQYIFSTTFVNSSDRHKIRGKMKEILEAARGNWHRFSISVPDLEFGAPEDNLYEIYECCKTAQSVSCDHNKIALDVMN